MSGARALVAAAALVLAVAACGAAPAAGGGPTTARPADTVSAGRRAVPDTLAGRLGPTGHGSLRQDEVAIQLQTAALQVRAIPLDEAVIRTLAPDSERALRDLVASRRARVDSVARRAGVPSVRVWYVTFIGLEPETRYSPMDLLVTSAGREFRPLEALPLTRGFGAQRVGQREMQSALYVFDGALDVAQPVVVTYEGAQSAAWGQTLRRVERERALVRSRAAARP